MNTSLSRAVICKPPEPLDTTFQMPVLFLGGTIDMDQGEKWQNRVEEALKDCPVIILNPRRDQFDAAARQEKDDPYFRTQVEWELEGLERATRILMYFAPGSRSPISLLELGLFACTGKLLVCCPHGFWRKGNVDIVCEKLGIPQVESLEEAISSLRNELALKVIEGVPGRS